MIKISDLPSDSIKSLDDESMAYLTMIIEATNKIMKDAPTSFLVVMMREAVTMLAERGQGVYVNTILPDEANDTRSIN